MAAKRSLLLTIVALIYVVWGGFVVINVLANKAWDPDSHHWYPSDALWVVGYVGREPTLEEKKLNDARHEAQNRYEVAIWAASTAWSLVIFVAALGLLRRKNWARWMFIGLMSIAVAGAVWLTIFLRSLGMSGTSGSIADIVLILALGSSAVMLLIPSIAKEFRDDRS